MELYPHRFDGLVSLGDHRGCIFGAGGTELHKKCDTRSHEQHWQ